MSLLINFTIGFLAALVGVIPPGLLNMSAAKISMAEGRKKGLLFSAGVCVTVLIQTYVALLFARYLDMHPEIIDLLRKVALGIFIGITVYFLFIARDTRRDVPKGVKPNRTNRFVHGMFLAIVNLLPLPYWVYVSITFAGFGWFSFAQPELWTCVLASALGTFAMLAVYVWFFRRKEDRVFKVNMNYVIGIITAIISAITLMKILNSI